MAVSGSPSMSLSLASTPGAITVKVVSTSEEHTSALQSLTKVVYRVLVAVPTRRSSDLLAVIGFVSEVVRTVVVQRRDIGETPVAVQGQAAVGRIADHDGGQRIVIDVAVVGQHAGGDHRQGGVYIGRAHVCTPVTDQGRLPRSSCCPYSTLFRSPGRHWLCK